MGNGIKLSRKMGVLRCVCEMRRFPCDVFKLQNLSSDTTVVLVYNSKYNIILDFSYFFHRLFLFK